MLYTQLEYKVAAVMQGGILPGGQEREGLGPALGIGIHSGGPHPLEAVRAGKGCRSANSRANIKIIRGVKFTDGCEVIAKPGDLESQTAAA